MFSWGEIEVFFLEIVLKTFPFFFGDCMDSGDLQFFF